MKAWVHKISPVFDLELRTKFIAEIWLSTQDVAAEKIESLLNAFDETGAPTGKPTEISNARRALALYSAMQCNVLLAVLCCEFNNLRSCLILFLNHTLTHDKV